jgi:serine/threonine protein kinase
VIGTVFAKRYEIRGFLGKGGMGEVWYAHDHNQGRDVALKLFPAGSVTIHAYHEAKILTLIASENVLRVFNADTFIDVPYIATEIAAGTTEDRAVAAPGLGLPAPVVVKWIRHCLVGLDACHGMHLVHRDIKASNLFLSSDHWGLLGDFGIAHPIDANGRVPIGGTPVTMPPEMLTLGYGTKVSDIYAVGVTAYRLLVGRWPFDAATIPELRNSVVNRLYLPLRDAAPHVSRRLAERLERAMAADPGDRYPSAMALHHDLGQADLVRLVWQRVAPHTGHAACWQELRSDGPARQVCAIRQGTRTNLETRFTASGRKLTAHCYSDVRAPEVSIKLRKIFDRL